MMPISARACRGPVDGRTGPRADEARVLRKDGYFVGRAMRDHLNQGRMPEWRLAGPTGAPAGFAQRSRSGSSGWVYRADSPRCGR
jgi:hypothetical protein